MLIKTPNKELAFRAVINTWLKDKSMYCNHCGQNYNGTICCENPQIGKNIDHCAGIIKQNKEIAKSRKNDFASTEDKTIRWGVSIPPSLYSTLNNFKKIHNQPGLFCEDGELNWFMKKFPQFKVCNKV